MVFQNDGPNSWKSRRQDSVALSTSETEYMSVSEVDKEILYLRVLLHDVGHEQTVTTNICEDNLAYLIDAGFEIDVTKNKDNKGELTNEYEIFIEKSSALHHLSADRGFKWDDLKYDFVPFLELLSMKGNKKKN